MTNSNTDVTAAALARIEAARAFAERVDGNQAYHPLWRAAIESVDVPILAGIAAAAVRLVEFQRDRGGVEDWPWWGWQGEDGAGCYGCLGSDDALDNPIGDGAGWDEFPHADDCRAMQLDAAIRAAGGPTS